MALLIRQRMLPVGVRLVLGLAVSVAGTHYLGSLPFGIDARDPASFAGAAAFLVCVAMPATQLPTWRAARVDPMVALRQDYRDTFMGGSEFKFEIECDLRVERNTNSTAVRFLESWVLHAHSVVSRQQEGHQLELQTQRELPSPHRGQPGQAGDPSGCTVIHGGVRLPKTDKGLRGERGL